jgi:hypothetical protein
MREQTRGSYPAMTLSELCHQPKHPPSACRNLRRRQPKPLEVVWRSPDPRKGCQIILSPPPAPVLIQQSRRPLNRRPRLSDKIYCPDPAELNSGRRSFRLLRTTRTLGSWQCGADSPATHPQCLGHVSGTLRGRSSPRPVPHCYAHS